jgi:sugar lactone lactonase YvrE
MNDALGKQGPRGNAMTAMTSIRDFRLRKEDLHPVGCGLGRPECILPERDGTLWISDNHGGVTRIAPNGNQKLIGTLSGDPNGIAMEAGGAFLIANISAGKLQRLHRDGRSEVVLDELGGKPLGAVNFVTVDDVGRIWVTVSTRAEPRSQAVHHPRPDGYVILLDATGARIVGNGFHFANEIRIDHVNSYAYVAETALGRVVRHKLDGALNLVGPPEVYGPSRLFEGALIDGITFDAQGNLWVTEITRHALVVITPDGSSHTVFEDLSGTFLNFPTSIAFGGPDLRTAYVGSLKMDHILRFEAPFPGQRPPYW